MSNAIETRGDRAVIEMDSNMTGRVVESVVLRGDISALNAEERARYYVQLCDHLGLSAASQPFAPLKLNGKEILYATRGATDQLAALHKLTRRMIDGPRVIDVAGTKLVYAVCEATHPNGRAETATATLPVADPANMLMKCETKAKRRATLSILGLGMLDETELETIPASAKSAAPPIVISDAQRATRSDDTLSPHTPSSHADASPVLHPLVQEIHDALLAVQTVDDVVRVWVDRDARLFAAAQLDTRVAADAEKQCVEKLVCLASDKGKATSESSARGWLKEACVKERARRASTPPEDGPKDDGPKGGKRTRPAAKPANDQTRNYRDAEDLGAPTLVEEGARSRWVFVEDDTVMRTADERNYTHAADGNAWRTHLEREPNWYAMVGAYTKRVELFGALGGDRRAALVDAVAARRNTDRVRAEELIAPEIKRQVEARKQRERRAA